MKGKEIKMVKSVTRRLLEKVNLGIYRPFPRSMIGFVRDNLENNLTGVEIGVFGADHAENIMETLNIKKLYLVDPYEERSDYGKDENNDSRILNLARREAMRKMAKYGDRVEFIKRDSISALEFIPDNLDFVYVDGNHSYEFVKRDMEEYYKKIRTEGILGGHDIQNGFCAEHDGVLEAFVDFVKEKKLKPNIWIPDWWIIKEGLEDGTE
jgi:hypothetical protein